jgi:hypothetical protein
MVNDFRQKLVIGIAAIVIIGVMLLGINPPVGNIFSNIVKNSGTGPMVSAPQPVAGAGNDQFLSPAQRGQPPPGTQRIILKNASLVLVVADPTQTIKDVTQSTEGIGGWIVNSNVVIESNQTITLKRGTISVRIPADKLPVFLAQVKGSALSVVNETVTGEDVTQTYVDLSSQLTNLQSSETQLQKIMTQAGTITEVLAVQTQLTTVRGQIEQVKGRLQYFDQAAAYSFVALTLNEKPVVATPSAETTLGLSNWSIDTTLRQVASAFVGAVQVVITFLIWVIVFGIPLLVILRIGWWLTRGMRGKQKASA